MKSFWEIALFCMPAALFLPVIYVLLRYSAKPDSADNGTAHPQSASILMLSVVVTMMVAWAWVGYGHFFRH